MRDPRGREGASVDEFEHTQRNMKGPGTAGWWDKVIPTLDPEQQQSLEAAGTNPNISHRTISVVLERWGHRVTQAQVGHWRRNHVR